MHRGGPEVRKCHREPFIVNQQQEVPIAVDHSGATGCEIKKCFRCLPVNFFNDEREQSPLADTHPICASSDLPAPPRHSVDRAVWRDGRLRRPLVLKVTRDQDHWRQRWTLVFCDGETLLFKKKNNNKRTEPVSHKHKAPRKPLYSLSTSFPLKRIKGKGLCHFLVFLNHLCELQFPFQTCSNQTSWDKEDREMQSLLDGQLRGFNVVDSAFFRKKAVRAFGSHGLDCFLYRLVARYYFEFTTGTQKED